MKAPKFDTLEKKALPRAKLARFVCGLDALPLDSANTVAARMAVLGGLRRGEMVYTPWASSDMTDTYVQADDTANREAVSRLSEMLAKENEKGIASGNDVPLDVPPRKKEAGNGPRPRIIQLVPLTGFEPAAFCSGGRRSIP